MAKYRKRPMIVEAYLVSTVSVKSLPSWCKGKTTYDSDTKPDGISIHTLEGKMVANIGDWIIKGVKGEFYPCKPDIFEATYERVEE